MNNFNLIYTVSLGANAETPINRNKLALKLKLKHLSAWKTSRSNCINCIPGPVLPFSKGDLGLMGHVASFEGVEMSRI